MPDTLDAPVAASAPAAAPPAPACLVLEDGTVFRGRAFGAAPAVREGEVVFSTSMTGYPEALTDPSYAGQILVMTPTQVGNYGVAPEDMESAGVQVAGFAIRALARRTSNHRARIDLGRWLEEAGVPAIDGIDTRALVRRLRTAGAMRGVIATGAPGAVRSSLDERALLERCRAAPSMAGRDLVSACGGRAAGAFEEDLGEWADKQVGDRVRSAAAAGTPRPRIVALDCGAKRNILRHLVERGCEVVLLPFDASADEVRAAHPDGFFLSNGPGDPAAVTKTIETIRAMAGEVPTFGICLGQQLIALAFGASTYKLPFGHRGSNQPVRDDETGRVEITSQNHGFCVDEASLEGTGLEVTHRHLNDRTVAGLRHRDLPVRCVQFHPEAAPGPHDAGHLFDRFVLDVRASMARRAAGG